MIEIAVFHDTIYNHDIRVVLLPNGLHSLISIVPVTWRFVKLEHVEVSLTFK